MITLLETAVINQHPVKLEQKSKRRFIVTYGEATAKFDYFALALREFNNCVRHSCQCAGYLD